MQTFEWGSGEHVGCIGPTGQGKTTLINSILPLHPYVVVFGTKPRDRNLDKLISEYDYIRIKEWARLDPNKYPRRILWPDMGDFSTSNITAADTFHKALSAIYTEGAWTVDIDELFIFVSSIGRGGMGLEGDVMKMLTQARSMHISLIAGTQRPRNVPLELYSQATHLFFWRTTDDVDLDRIGGLGTRNSSDIRFVVKQLQRYQFLYINTRTDEMIRSKAPNPI